MELSPIPRYHTLLPYWGEGWQDEVAVRTLRMSLVLVAALTPIFGLIYSVTSPDVYDPWWARTAMTVGSVGLLIASYRLPVVRDRPRLILSVLAHAILLWFAVLVAINDLEVNQAVGFLFVELAVVLAYSLVWDEPGPVARIVVVSALIGTTAAASVDPADAGLHPLSFVLCIASGSLVVFLTLNARLQAAQELRLSEGRLARAEALARTGAWSLDLRTTHLTWSEGAYRILGIDPGQPPVPITAFVHPDDLPRLAADEAMLYADSARGDFRYRVVRPDGEVRMLRSVVQVGRDDDGEVVRLDGVFLDVTEAAAHAEALEEARDAAEAASRSKDEFLANMSHEIRTPLSAIIGYAGMLREETGGVHDDLLLPIEAGGHRLLDTLSAILDLAWLESGQTRLGRSVVDVSAAATAVVDGAREEAERKGLAIRLDMPPAHVLALADEGAVRKAIGHLVSNAVKFTSEGDVVVAVDGSARGVEVAILDTGCGIDPDQAQTLFEPFHQASSGWQRSHEGAGLGLSVTHKLVHAMGGAIHVESQPGEGARFTIVLPAAPSGDGAIAGAPRLNVPRNDATPAR